MSTSIQNEQRLNDGLTVFERAAARVNAVQESDKLIARQREQIKEIEAQVIEMRYLRHRWQAALMDNTDTFHDAIHKYEAQLIITALQRANGRLSQAARLLGISYQSLSYMLDNHHKELRHLRSERKNRKKRAK
jgi:DNA-binding NtrC family response regulator